MHSMACDGKPFEYYKKDDAARVRGARVELIGEKTEAVCPLYVELTSTSDGSCNDHLFPTRSKGRGELQPPYIHVSDSRTVPRLTEIIFVCDEVTFRFDAVCYSNEQRYFSTRDNSFILDSRGNPRARG